MPPETQIDDFGSNAQLSERMRSEAHWIRGIAQRLLRDENLVDEVVQQTFVAWLRKPPRDGGIRAWLRTVVTNFVRMQAREQKRRRAREERVARSEMVIPKEQGVEVSELREQLSEAVLTLDEPYRSTILEIYFNEKSARELSRELQVPANTVLVRRKRALEKLRERLKSLSDDRDWRLGLLLLYAVNFPEDFADGGFDGDDPHEDDPDGDDDGDAGDSGDPAHLSPEELLIPAAMSQQALSSEVLSKQGLDALANAIHSPVAHAAKTRWMRWGGVAALPLVLLLGYVASSSWLAGATNQERAARGDLSPQDERVATFEVVPPALDRQEAPKTDSADVSVIRVLDGESGAPIDEARVSLGEFDLRSENVGHGRDLIEFLMLPYGESRGDTNSLGELALPRSEFQRSRLSVSATGYGEYREPHRYRAASSLLENEAEPYEVYLWPAELTTLRVLRPQGGAATDVTVRWRGASQDSWQSASTDGLGEVSIPMDSDAQLFQISDDRFAHVSRLVRGARDRTHVATAEELPRASD